MAVLLVCNANLTAIEKDCQNTGLRGDFLDVIRRQSATDDLLVMVEEERCMEKTVGH